MLAFTIPLVLLTQQASSAADADTKEVNATAAAKFKTSVEFAVKSDRQVFALLDGTVKETGLPKAEGRWVTVSHAYPDVETKFSNLSTYSVKAGEIVKRGRLLGIANKKQGHLSFSVKNDKGQALDPIKFLEIVPEFPTPLNENLIELADIAKTTHANEEAAEPGNKSETSRHIDGQASSLIEDHKLLLEEMEANMQRELTFAPKDTSLWFQYGSWKESLKEFDTALSAYKKICQLESENKIALEKIAKISLLQETEKPPSKSTIKISRAQSEQIFDIDLLIASSNANSYNTALKILSEAIRSDPTNIMLWIRVGICKQELKDYQNALTAYEMACKLSPDNSKANEGAEAVRRYLADTTTMWGPATPSLAPNYLSYLKEVGDQIKRHWHTREQNKVATWLEFKINRVGQVSDLTVTKHSESKEFDNSVLAALKNALPFAPLPKGAPGFINITVSFNEQPMKDMEFSTEFGICLESKAMKHASQLRSTLRK